MRGELEIHPDDLLQRARGGGAPLSWDEQAHVDVHLRACATCKFLLDAGRAFEAEGAEPIGIDLQRLIRGTLRATSADRGHPMRAPGRRLAAAAITALVMLGGVAFAGYWGARHPSGPAISPGPAVAIPAVAPVGAAAAPAPRSTPIETLTPPVEPAVRSWEATRRRVAVAPVRHVSRTAADLFISGNRARRMGDDGAARAAYDQLWASFRSSPEAVASRTIYGRWMLDRGQPELAISLFRQYLTAAPSGDLAEEALVGLAVAQERMGATAPAAATWRRLLSEHPSSVHVPRARQRIRTLDGGTT
jgi:tetratricopeptide repeat protein